MIGFAYVIISHRLLTNSTDKIEGLLKVAVILDTITIGTLAGSVVITPVR